MKILVFKRKRRQKCKVIFIGQPPEFYDCIMIIRLVNFKPIRKVVYNIITIDKN